MRNLIAPAALAAGLMLGSAALAASPPAATSAPTASTAPGVQQVVVGRTTIGAPIEQMTVSRPLSYVGLNLTNPADVRIIDQQIQDTAEKECAELRDQSNDLRNPTIAGGYCVRSAAREARSTLSAAVSGAKAFQ
jgi:UrcA family protein